MLLRNNTSSGEADQDVYLNMTSSASSHEELEVVTTTHVTEQLTTTTTTTSIYHTGHDQISAASDMNDDVWGDEDDTDAVPSSEQPAAHLRAPPPPPTGLSRAGRGVSVSDIPRLRQEHTTAGYRDGVTAAKAASVQAGFDEGYGLGATIGARAGRLVGVLNGLVGAVSSSSFAGGDSWVKDGEKGLAEMEKERLQGLLENATKELSVLSVFGEEYFARDGIWRYQVVKEEESKKNEGEKTASCSREAGEKEEQHQQQEIAQEAEGKERAGEEEEAIVFADIAASHPLLRKWDGIVQQEVERYALVWDVLLPEEEDHHHEKEDEDAGQQAVTTTEKGKEKDGKKSAPPAVRQNKGALAW